MRKPTWKASHRAWYCVINGKQTRLGPRGPQNKAADQAAAEADYHKLKSATEPVTEKTPAAVVFDQFLDWVGKNQAPRTYEWYRVHLQSFKDWIGDKLTVGQVKKNHVTRWLESSYRSSGDTHKNGAARSVIRAFNWAKDEDLIAVNPVAKMKRPAAKHREDCLTTEQWTAAIALVKTDDPFADLIWFLRLTGCRPVEARTVEAKHWNRQTNCLVLELANSKGKKVRRVIRLAGRALEIVQRVALKNPTGPLFLNAKGTPWTAFSMNCRFAKLKKKLGFAFYPYIMRHSFVTDALMRGVDVVTLATLVGHCDGTMIMKVYAHVAQNEEFLAAKARQAIGESA